MATIKDVAKKAGVSISTVSRALSGNIPVSDETKEKVLAAVETLNYQPNVLAKGLKEGRTNTIGLIIPNIRNPIFPAVARGVEDGAREKGFTVILCNSDEDLAVEKDYVEKLRKRWVDGLIFATAGEDSSHILKLKQSGFPVVLLVRGMGPQVDAVLIDNFQAAHEAVSYLISRGHKEIAMINGPMSLALYKERFDGYRKALEDASLPVRDELIAHGDFRGKAGSEFGYTAMQKLLDSGEKIESVFAANDLRAIGAIRAIKDRGLRVPEDISVVGFDDLEFSSLLDPPLTTIAQPLYEMGYTAVNNLINLIEDKAPRKEAVIEFKETKLVIRKSTR